MELSGKEKQILPKIPSNWIPCHLTPQNQIPLTFTPFPFFLFFFSIQFPRFSLVFFGGKKPIFSIKIPPEKVKIKMFKKHDEPVVGVPYFVGVNPYQASVIYGDPKGIPIHQTMYRDTPAPFNCPYCGNSGLTIVR